MLSLLLMAIVAIQVSIIQTYMLLKHENPNWWWRSFLIGFCTSFWTFMLSYDYYFFLGEGYGIGSLIIFSGAAGIISLAPKLND
jgi:multidrug transporter EmrE-like cation transporter